MADLRLIAEAIRDAAQAVLAVDPRRIHLRADVAARGVWAHARHTTAVIAVRVGDWATGGSAVVHDHDEAAAAHLAVAALRARLTRRAAWLRAHLAATEAALRVIDGGGRG